MKSILLVMTPFAGIYLDFKRNLEASGYDVRLVVDYRNKTRLIQEAAPADFALVICPGDLTDDELACLRGKVGRLVAYQWMGLRKRPGVKDKRSFFDAFYVFDPEDVAEGFELRENFWFDHLAEPPAVTHPPVDAYFLGSYDPRASSLIALAGRINGLGLSLRMIMAGSFRGPRPNISGVSFPRVGVMYSDNLDHVRSAKVILDVHNEDVHDGLSFRVFEALGAGRKLVTTNKQVIYKDFYHPDNVHLLTDDDTSLADFFSRPMTQIDQTVRIRYGFKAWVSSIF